MSQVPLEFRIGEEVESCTVAQWLVVVGERVRAEQPLVELEVDKASLEFVAPCDGVVVAITAQTGTEIERGAVLGWLSTREDKASTPQTATQTNKTTWGVCVRADCSRCGARVALNSLMASITCFECGDAGEISQETWTALARAMMSGEDRFEVRSGAWVLTAQASEGQAACHNCRTPLDVNEVGSIVCTPCGTSHENKPPPSWLVESFARLRAIVGTVETRCPAPPSTCEQCNTPLASAVCVPVPRCPICGRDVRPQEPPPIPRAWYLISD